MYKPHIALEVRILLGGEAGSRGVKTFCPCAVPDSCPVCRGEAPPALNPQAAGKAYLLTRGLGGSVIREAAYERNLATPPTPEGHALSRYSVKLGENAFMDITFHRRKKRIRIDEIRIEEDAGRLIRPAKTAGNQEAPEGPRKTEGPQEPYMDYSSAGLPSLRLKTAADFETGEEAELFLSELRRRIQYLEILRQGPAAQTPWESLIRCNAYAAIAPYPQNPDYCVKLRNLNSFNFVYKAINAELSRQEEILANGGAVVSESRMWNEAKNATEPFGIRAREKRRFESPPVPPFIPGPGILEALDRFSAELPESRRNRLMDQYGLTRFQAEFVCDEKSRADYFEKTAAFGAPAGECAQWMASCVVKELRRLKQAPATAPLGPERFARILAMLRERKIHGGIARQLIRAVLEEDRDPDDIVRGRGWEQLTDRAAVEALVKKAVDGNPREVRRIREGDAGPIQFLTGLVMKESAGLAEPALVKELLREQLSVSLVYVLSMGGAISGRVGEDGAVESGDGQILRKLLAGGGGAQAGGIDASRVRVESIQVGRLLSEEIVPADWAALIETVAEKLNSGTANGIVVAHGTDTLAYTAPLLYWLFAGSGAPVVLAASSSTPDRSSEAAGTMRKAVSLALNKPKGVYVAHGGKVLSPLNLKFERIGFGADQFRNWNTGRPVFEGSSLLTGPLEADRYVVSQLLEEAVNSMCVIRIYPGLRSDYLVSLMDQGVKNFFLELYDTGTAGFREGPYSLKRAFGIGKRRNARFYCSSQQEGVVDFAGYATSRELWRAGAVPMGPYTTETAVARFLAASLIADSDEERAGLMEAAASEAPGG